MLGRFLLLTLIIAAGSMSGCDKKPEASADGEEPVAGELSDEAVDQIEIPVKEDFEEEAQAAINADNVEAQIEALAEEIESETR